DCSLYSLGNEPRPRGIGRIWREAEAGRAVRHAPDRKGSEQLEVRRGGAAVTAGLEVVGDLLAFAEAGGASPLDGRDVNERVLGAIVRLDEAEALGGVEEFYGTIDHGEVFRVVTAEDRDRKASVPPPRHAGQAV